MQSLFSKIIHTDADIGGNTRVIWYPFATTVLEGGVPYVDFWDIKPPLFQLVNVATAITGDIVSYTLVFYLLLGIVNGLTAIAIWQLLEYWGRPWGGLFGALSYLYFIPTVGFKIDPRQFGNLLTMLGFLTASSSLSGLSISAAGLFIQYQIALIPVLMLYQYLRTDGDGIRSHLTRYSVFVAAGLSLVIATFGAIAMIWGIDVSSYAFRLTFLGASEYSARHAGLGVSSVVSPTGFLAGLVDYLGSYDTIFWMSTVGAVFVVKDAIARRNSKYVIPILAILALGSSLIIRIAIIYYIGFLPFLTMLIGLGLDSALDSLGLLPEEIEIRDLRETIGEVAREYWDRR